MCAIIRLMFLGMALIAGCIDSICKRRMEIAPGLTMEYYTLYHSRIVSRKYGVVAEGWLSLSFCEYGIDISGGDKGVYVDMLRNVLDESVETRRRVASGCTNVFDVASAMGIFSKEPHREFLAMMKALKDRVRERQRQDGVRPL